ncbi:threonyl-tRNA synthetase [Sorochytrium milnesiophthora]
MHLWRRHIVSTTARHAQRRQLHSTTALAVSDHRTLGQQQQLFAFNDASPGSPFFLAHGTRVINALLELMRAQYRRYGYSEIMSPILYKQALWKQSGHWDNYRDDMFAVEQRQQHHHGHGNESCAQLANASEEEQEHGLYGIKPMNCPGHCLLFGDTKRSYKELPIRWADFSPLHRYAVAAVRSALTDAHV